MSIIIIPIEAMRLAILGRVFWGSVSTYHQGLL